MSQAKITLRPPPNVEFVQGWPGIPPAAPDRPQAAVKGTIELRLGSQGVKAKWVRIELRKVETLPGGGQTNTFYDFVGQSPVNIWQAQEEWGMLFTQDFPFFIRIPESIPPSIALEKNAGIKYELIATVCIKGKKGLLRRNSSPTLTTMAPVIIDKHELHSTWPVYAQPESRHVTADALTLTVDRTHTCYGPGDRVAVMATLKSDNLSTVVLRAFEFTLKETIIFRSGPHVPGKKAAPIVKVSVIGEQKVPVNATLFGGTRHKAELACIIAPTHTSTTVNAARHIDIAYSINVVAVMGNGKPLVMDLPVTISNWPRTVSMEAVRRIGPSPNLSLIPPGQLHNQVETQQMQQPPAPVQPNTQINNPAFQLNQTVPARMQGNQVRPANFIPEKVAPPPTWQDGASRPDSRFVVDETSYGDGRGGFAGPSQGRTDEFGRIGTAAQKPATYGGPGPVGHSVNNPNNPAVQEAPLPVATPSSEAGTRRPRSATAQNAANRFTVVNMTHEDTPELPSAPAPAPAPAASSSTPRYLTAEEEKRRLQNAANDSAASRSYTSDVPARAAGSRRTEQPDVQPTPGGGQPAKRWLSAEEEKRMLYEKAKADAERIQAGFVGPKPSQASQLIPQQDTERPRAVDSGSMRPSASTTKWPTAEEEKERLFNQAQEVAKKTQARAVNSSPPMMSNHTKSLSTSSNSNSHAGGSGSMLAARPQATDSTPAKSPGAQLYQQAMASVHRNTSAQAGPVQPHTQPQDSRSRANYPSAEEEKAAMRYYEAKRAVDRRQNTDYSPPEPTHSVPTDEPISYDALYPSEPGPRASSSHDMSSPVAAPSAFTSPGSQSPHSPGFRDQMTGVGVITPPSASSLVNEEVLSEKERLRRRYEAQDAAASAGNSMQQPSPPPRSNSSFISGPSPGYEPPQPRSQPLPPSRSMGDRPLTAAEEKARLRAQYEAEDADGGGPSNMRPTLSSHTTSSSSQSGMTLSRDPSISFGKLKLDNMDDDVTPPPPPPPLLPRPPADYIQETQQEDARTQAEEEILKVDPNSSDMVSWEMPTPDYSMNARAFSPLDTLPNGNGLTENIGSDGPHRPPLPPKVPISST
ncbi:hypothetical protein BD410DRAFT_835623 [Rickenella mellea]|uniref:Arrestin C-terminal-like domain-containing protein n=1 Tax=Rickenella mellea TaxID=50990 RepID=A0A4Y7QI63_9AGAM|nr:hypothetical protein BD410DRAFT_835623 [Rickenella mellea]